MSDAVRTPSSADAVPREVDVLIIGAGLSGIGAACHLRRQRPGTTFTILEAREEMGGTWDLFRYPGIRSDSDMFTLGYGFRPWDGDKSIADGESIRRYIRETAEAYGIEEEVRYRRRVTTLAWDSTRARWTAQVTRTDTGAVEEVTSRFVYSCTGYYRYDEGYTPDFPGVEDFAGTLVHPQRWPGDLDVAGKQVVVIGSGATAMTLVPALAEAAGHVTMLQRSPSYVASLPDTDAIADGLRRVLPAGVAHSAIKWKNVAVSSLVYQLSQRAPWAMKRVLRARLQRQLPATDIDAHFTPTYDPWDQRLCLVPNNDLFKALRAGRASMVTDTIGTFTADGIRLGSGEELTADVVITATGLNLLMLGGIELVVDGAPVDVPSTVAYKGMMLSGVPNFALAIGYTNASWTLKVDLVSDYVCRLLDHMDAQGYDVVTPLAPDPSEPVRPLIDLTSGYVLRSIDDLPRQGTRAPWRLHQNYALDVNLFRRGDVDDEGVVFSSAFSATSAVAEKAAAEGETATARGAVAEASAAEGAAAGAPVDEGVDAAEAATA